MLTLTLTLRTEPADSAINTLFEGEFGSNTAAAIFDFNAIGLPNILPDLASRFCLLPRSALCEPVSGMFCGLMASELGSHLTLTQKSGEGRRNSF